MIINGQHYIVWAGGKSRPDSIPNGCEYYEYSYMAWMPCSIDPSEFRSLTYRWPVTEAEYKTHHWCLANDVEVPHGYEVIGFGEFIAKGEHALAHTGDIYIEYMPSGIMLSPRPIVKKIDHKTEYVTPTNQDIIDCIMATGTWPVVDVCDIEDDVEFNIKWTASMLSHVIFVGGIGSGFMDIDGTYWDDARMLASLRDEWAKKKRGQ